MRRPTLYFVCFSLLANVLTVTFGAYYAWNRYLRRYHFTSLFDQYWRPDFNNDMPATLERCPAADIERHSVKNLFIGDSLTNGLGWEKAEKPNVTSFGIAGEITDCLLYRLPLILQDSPQQIFMMVGLNDLASGKNPILVAANYERLLSSLRLGAPKTAIFAESVLPIVAGVKEGLTNEKVRELNAWIERLARRMGATYIDLFPRFLDERGGLDKRLTSDGVHLNQLGYALWKEVVSKYLSN